MSLDTNILKIHPKGVPDIKNSILKNLNTEINAYSSTGEKITIPLKNIINRIDIDID